MSKDWLYMQVNYGIIPIDEDTFLVPNVILRQRDSEEELEYIEDEKDFKEEHLENLVVEADDILFVYSEKIIDEISYKIKVKNLRNNTEGYVIDYFYSDDSRVDLASRILYKYKDIQGIQVKVYLIYNESLVNEYIDNIENI